MFQCDQVFSKTDVANYTVETAERMNVVKNQLFFWTNHQKNIIDTNQKRVLFTSEFGTGKTTLLRAKAKQLNNEKEIFFVLFTEPNGLLFHSIAAEFKDQDHVKVVSLKSELILK